MTHSGELSRKNVGRPWYNQGMSSNPDRDEFLSEQARRLGEPIQAFALVRVLGGPSLGSELVFLFVVASGVEFFPSARDASIFGIPLPGKKVAPPEPRKVRRDQVTSFGALKASGFWERLTGPQGVIELRVHDAGTELKWHLQLVGEADTFVREWSSAWTMP